MLSQQGTRNPHRLRLGDAMTLPPPEPLPIGTASLQPLPSTFRAADLMNVVERYMEQEDSNKVYHAFLFAAEAHSGQLRADGVTPYITHPLTVAKFLAELHLDADTICAALLHDVPEDTERTLQDVRAAFGETVSNMVDGVTKLKRDDKLTTKQAVAKASYHKMMQAMTKDFRVVMVKLADRLHNMRTLHNVAPEKRRRVALETSSIYVALARRLGMNKIRRELQQLCFENLYPWRSCVLAAAYQQYLEANEAKHQQIFNMVFGALQASIPRSQAIIWEKNLFRVYDQALRHRRRLREQYDLLEISVQVGEVAECYQAVGIIHSLFKPRMGMFRDFIAAPRAYGFQALQTTVIASSGQQVRFQIQTREMFNVAQYGLAAPRAHTTVRSYTQGVFEQWLEQVKAFDQQAQNHDEFYDAMQGDVFQTEIYAYTPEGEVKELPRGATVLDFAYAVHTEIGHHCAGAKIDGRLEYLLRSRIPNTMATIEILTAADAHPQVEWLSFVKTSRAQSSIRAWLRQHGMLRGEERKEAEKQLATLCIEIRDVKGVLRQITKVLDSLDINIVDLKITGEGRIKQDILTIQVDDQTHLQAAIHQLKRLQHVLHVRPQTNK